MGSTRVGAGPVAQQWSAIEAFATDAYADHTMVGTGVKETWGTTTITVPTGRAYQVIAIASGWTVPPGGTTGLTFRHDVQISLDGGGSFTTSKEMVSQTNVAQSISFTCVTVGWGRSGLVTGTIQIRSRCQQDAGALGKFGNHQLVYAVVPA